MDFEDFPGSSPLRIVSLNISRAIDNIVCVSEVYFNIVLSSFAQSRETFIKCLQYIPVFWHNKVDTYWLIHTHIYELKLYLIVLVNFKEHSYIFKVLNVNSSLLKIR